MHRCTLDFIALRRTTGIYDDLNGFMRIEVSGSLLLEPLGCLGAYFEAFGIAWARCGHLLGYFGGPWLHLAPM